MLEANGYIRFTDGATIPNDTDEDNGYDSIFKEKTGVSDGTALEFSVYPNHIELIDKDYVPPLTKSDGTQLLKQEQANALNGYLHMRFYQQSGTDNSPQHTATDENTKQVTQKYVAYAYTTAYPGHSYMGLYIKDLHFYARSYQKPKNGSKYARVTAITVVLTIAKKDANGQSVTLCTQKAIIALPGEPVYIVQTRHLGRQSIVRNRAIPSGTIFEKFITIPADVLDKFKWTCYTLKHEYRCAGQKCRNVMGIRAERMTRMATIEIKMLGGFEIRVNGKPVLAQLAQSRKATALVQYLVLRRGERVSHKVLTDTLWAGERSTNPDMALRAILHRFRLMIDAEGLDEMKDCIVTSRGYYQWNPHLDCSVDVFEVNDLSELAREEERRPRSAAAFMNRSSICMTGACCRSLRPSRGSKASACVCTGSTAQPF